MSIILKNNIVIDPNILGGTSVVAGTRIPIERIQQLVKQGCTTSDLKKEYPKISPKKIQLIISLLMEVGLDAFTKKSSQIQVAS